ILQGAGQVDPTGAGVLLFGSLAWAAGSIYSRHAVTPAQPLLGTAMQMLAGGAALLLAGVIAGEPAAVDVGAISGRSLAGLAYLIVFGSIIGFSAYIWLLRVCSPARV